MKTLASKFPFESVGKCHVIWVFPGLGWKLRSLWDGGNYLQCGIFHDAWSLVNYKHFR